MFKVKTRVSFCLLSLLSLYFFWGFSFSLQEQDYFNYQKLMNSLQKQENSTGSQTIASQFRKNISKELVFTKEGERIKWIILSPISRFSLEKQLKAFHLKETLDSAKLVMFEKKQELDCFPFNFSSVSDCETTRFRYIESKQMTYDYKTAFLFATEVNFRRYLLLGKNWKETIETTSPLLNAYAETMECQVLKKPDLILNGLKVDFFNL